MTEGRTKFQINISDEDEGSRNSLESGKVLFKKTLPDKEVVSTSSSSPSKSVAQSGDNNTVSQSSQSKQNSQSTGSALGGKSFAQTFAYLKNTDLYKLPSKPVHEAHPLPKNTNSIIVNGRQRGNPILKHVKNVPWEYGDIIPDYQIGERHCVLFLSLRYHNLNPDYIHERLKLLGNRYDLRVILVLVDVKNCKHNLKELGKMCLLAGCTLILAWSPEEAGRYLETYKQYENKPPDILQERVETDYFAKIQDVLTTVKSINKTDAITLLSTFGSLQNIVNASKDEIEVCPGFGQLKAQRLHKVFNEPFKRANVHVEQSQQSKSSVGSTIVGEQSLDTLELKKPSEHTYLQKCLSQNCESPPRKVKRVAVDNTSSSKPVPLPVSDSSISSHSSPEKLKKTLQASSAGVSEIPSKSDDWSDSENLSIKEIYEKIKPREENIPCALVKQPPMSPSSTYDISKKSISLEGTSKDLQTTKDIARAQKSKSIPLHKMSKSEAVFKSGLSISRSRKDSGGSRVPFNKASPEKGSKLDSRNRKDSGGSREPFNNASPEKRSKLDSRNRKDSGGSREPFNNASPEKGSMMKTTNVFDDNQKLRQSNSDIPVLIDKSPNRNNKQQQPVNVVTTHANKCGSPTSASVETCTAHEMKKKSVIVDSRLSNTGSSEKVRIGTTRKISESEPIKDAFKESYSQQLTNDEFLDLIADDDDDDDDDDII